MTVRRSGKTIHSSMLVVQSAEDFASSVAAEIRKYELDNPDDPSLWNSSFEFVPHSPT